MLVTYPDIYAAQRHHDQAVEPPSRYIIAPPFTNYVKKRVTERFPRTQNALRYLTPEL